MMSRFILKRLSNILFTICLLSLFLFFLVRAIPGSPEMVLLMNRGGAINNEELTIIRGELGLNTSVFYQYMEWFKNVIRLDFGSSYQSGLPVLEEILSRVTPTLLLTSVSLVISTLSGIMIAFYSSLHREQKWSGFISHVAIFLSSLPNYLIGLFCVLLFSIHWRIFPVYGNDSWVHLILPVFTICVPLIAVFYHLFRQIMEEVLESHYFEAAQSRGVKNTILYGKILFFPCLHGFLTIIATNIGSLWGGIIVTETIFAWPGIGSYIINAVSVRDYPVIIGFTLIMACSTMFMYLIIDLLLRWTDPRQRWKERDSEW
ncbi:ABC transporter permease [Lederbergia sp. NSJ-179]|uniref:ABC transporter permease n=1 Tax=Lederbergia sp. NSJ-179 TaxID=2931402 RepID=UPI001FCFCE8F|nr:ABC transporter permease [Lederbergia sp. NSJ-179]MCJ7840870.1 ABC transporter permease [Lederbergia sp. NSJ-179]